MKRFVICLDGTWNNASREVVREEGSRVYRPTNVLKLARATLQEDSDGVLQVTYYDAGVGSMNRAPDFASRINKFVDNSLGGGWGAGFNTNIEEAYTFLANNYAKGDEIFVFGFSRGAAQARSLCRLIEWFGGFPSKNDVYYVPRIFSRYLNSKGDRAQATLWDELNARRAERGDRPLEPIQPGNIVFLGVWDTVLALGSRFTGGGRTTNKEKQFHTPAEPPEIVSNVRHAIAIDEARHDFQPEVFREDTQHPSLEQRWFAGVHSDVGGGLASDSLANCALRWIVSEAQDAGLGVRDEYLKFFRKYPQGAMSKKSTKYKIADALMRPVRGFNGVRKLTSPPGMTVDDSVFARLKSDHTGHKDMSGPYRPKNLLTFLADQGEYDDNLSADALSAVKALRKG
jgi:uncharacterized protein (DUF2235 family)